MNKKKGRELHPLLPLEYCTIDRASRLLDCEVSDIVHWAKIGAIKTCLCFDNIPILTGIYQTVSRDDWSEIISTKWTSLTTRVSQCNDDSEMIETVASGFWELSPRDIKIDERGQWNTPRKMTLVVPYTAVEVTEPHQSDVFIDLHSAIIEDEGDFNLYIMRSDIEKLYEAITLGEPLLSVHNCDALMSMSERKRAEMTKLVGYRTSKPERKMILALLNFVPNLDKAMLAQPTTAFNVLDVELRNKKVETPCDLSTFTKWLKN